MDYKAGFCAGEKTTDSAALWQSLPFWVVLSQRLVWGLVIMILYIKRRRGINYVRLHKLINKSFAVF